MVIVVEIAFGWSIHLITSNSNAFIQCCRPSKRCEDNATLLNARSTWPAQQSKRLMAFAFEKFMQGRYYQSTLLSCLNDCTNYIKLPSIACQSCSAYKTYLVSIGLPPFGQWCKALQRQQQLAAAEREALRNCLWHGQLCRESEWLYKAHTWWFRSRILERWPRLKGLELSSTTV